MRARVSQLVPPPRARSPRRALAVVPRGRARRDAHELRGPARPATRPAPRAEPHDTGFPLELPTADAPHELRALMTDITGGRLAALHARSAREGPLELTELHLELSRSRPYPSEPGEYRLSLPADVRVTRLAAEMIINGWRDAVLVPRGPAVRRGPYERPVALLRTVSAAGEPLELELEAPTIRGQHVLLTLAGFAQHLPATVAARDGPRALVRARLPDDPRALIGPVVVLVDSSASMGPSWDRLNDYLERTLTALRSARRGSPAAPELALTIIAFDQTRETVFSGTLETSTRPCLRGSAPARRWARPTLCLRSSSWPRVAPRRRSS
ncbi:MAG: VWA domain-containing protein [Myxococcales bacterium]|nr:VWA domain-containing protein [Myxococcales bacterium]